MNPKKVYLTSAAVGIISACLVLLLYSFIEHSDKATKEQNDAYREHIASNYKIYSIPLPEKMEFAGERVPLEITDVAERMDREMLVNTFWHSNTFLSLKRANRWFPVIEPILASNGVPDDFKYLALIESGFMNVVSPAGAAGYWQFIEETGKSYGLEINSEVDERYNVEKATQAACQYLNQAYKRYGSWSLAAASYNSGMVGPQRQIDRQGEGSYYDLLLNEETSRYVFRIIAMKEIMNNAHQYGFVMRPSDMYAPFKFDTIQVDGQDVDLVKLAKENSVTYKELKIYNPWLRDNVLKNKSKKTYTIKIPKK
jgi:membrane-bound lytic murein transglycosylase D